MSLYAAGSIPIGHPAEFTSIYLRNGYEVARKTRDGKVTYIIARVPGKSGVTGPAPPPSSVVQEFSSQEEAIAVLDCWSSDPTPPRLPRKPRQPTLFRRKGNKPRRGNGPGQMMLPLQ